MNIGKAAGASGVPAKTIRYYESIGIIPRATRSDAGYRHYSDAEIHTLRFIKRARSLGFSIDQISELLALWHNKRRSSATIKAVVLKQVAALDAKAIELMAMSRTLKHLADNCSGDNRPECPILDDIAKSESHLASPPNFRPPANVRRFG